MSQSAYAYHRIPSGDEDILPGVDSVPSSGPPQDKTSRQTSYRVLLGVLFVALLSLCFLYVRETTYRTDCLFLHGNTASYAPEKLPSHFTLPSGDKIPSVGLGKCVWRASLSEVGGAVKVALRAGYRHIDGAWIYRNEREVGQAINNSSVPRKDIWITSKLWNTFHKPEDVEPALDDTLQKLGTDYVDLYLIHWPVAYKNDKGDIDFNLTENPYPTWKKMEELVKKGKARNIGVSNFSIRRLQNLTANPLEIWPAVNQVELNYWNPQPDLVKWSQENGILLEAYSPLGGEKKVKETLQIPEVKDIAKKLGMTPAQVYISWHVQRGTVVLPKSVTPSRIEENIQVTRLPKDAFECLEKAATSHKRLSNPN